MKTFVYHSDFIGDFECCLEYYNREHIISVYSRTEHENMWESFMIPTTTPSGILIPDGCVCFKDYEGKGMLDRLCELGVVEYLYTIPYGTVSLSMCRVTPKLSEYAA